MGKTRLAAEVAERRRSDGARVRFFDLRDVGRDEDLIERIGAGAAYAVTDVEGLLDRVTTHDPDELWVLDNCEPVLAAVGGLAPRLTDRGRRLRLLLTSTHQLPRDLRTGAAERLVPVPPLEEPDRVELLADRARALGVDVADDAWRRDASALAGALDGLPLELELVAAQLEQVEPRALLERLTARGLHTVEGLAPTIRAALERLDATTRGCAAGCSVFRGGFGPDAAAAVVGGPPEEVTAALGRLLRASLILPLDGATGARFHILQAVQSYLLASAERLDELRTRHLAFFADEAISRVREAEARDTGEQEAWLDRELGNLRAALAWAEERGDGERALALAVAMAGPLRGRGAIERSRRTIERLVEDAPPGELRVRARVALAEAERERGHREAGLTVVERALEEALERSDPRLEMLARRVRSLCVYAGGEFDRASDELERGLALAAEADAPVLANRLRSNGASFDLMTGRYERARERLLQTIEAARRLGDPTGLGHARGRLALLEHQRGRVHEAADLIRGAIEALGAERDAMMAGRFSYSACLILLEVGEPDAAHAYLVEAEDRFRRAGAARDRALGDHARATWLARTGALGDAATHALRAARAFEEVGDRTNATLDRALCAWLHAHLGDERLAREHASIAEELIERVQDEQVRVASGVYLAGVRALLDGAPAELAADRDDYDIRAARWLVERGLVREGETERVRVAPDGSGFEVPGREPVDLSRRTALMRILGELVRAGGEPRSSAALKEVGWPDERGDPDAANARLYVALSNLRKLGLADVLERTAEGYRLIPGTVRIAEKRKDLGG